MRVWVSVSVRVVMVMCVGGKCPITTSITVPSRSCWGSTWRLTLLATPTWTPWVTLRSLLPGGCTNTPSIREWCVRPSPSLSVRPSPSLSAHAQQADRRHSRQIPAHVPPVQVRAARLSPPGLMLPPPGPPGMSTSMPRRSTTTTCVAKGHYPALSQLTHSPSPSHSHSALLPVCVQAGMRRRREGERHSTRSQAKVALSCLPSPLTHHPVLTHHPHPTYPSPSPHSPITPYSPITLALLTHHPHPTHP